MAQARPTQVRPDPTGLDQIRPDEAKPVRLEAEAAGVTVGAATGETTPDEARQDSDFHRPRLPDGPDGEVRMPAAKARQGVIAGRIIIVLCAGIVLVALAFLVSYLAAV